MTPKTQTSKFDANRTGTGKGQTNEADLLVKKSAEAGYPLAVKKVNGVLFHRVEVLR